MKRRQFITLLGGAAAALAVLWPRAARAQQPAMPVIGFLGASTPEAKRVAAFRKGLGETGFVEGQNVAIEFRWAAGQFDRLPELVADLIRRRVAVIAAPANTAGALAAKAATTTIPIVFGAGGDPVAIGLVASLNRPGGNVTGVNILNVELTAKRLGLLRELAPHATRFVALANPNSAMTDGIVKSVQASAPALGLSVEILYANTDREIEAAFANLSQKPGATLLVGVDPFFFSRRALIVTLGGAPRAAHGLLLARIRRPRRTDQLRHQHRQHLRADRDLYRPRPQGREAGRPAGRAADAIRDGDQPRYREGARHRRSEHAARARRRGDRMSRKRCSVCVS